MADEKIIRNRYTQSIPNRSDVTSAVNFAYKIVDNIAQYAKAKTDDFMSQLMQISIDEFCNFNTRNGVYMMKLMSLNNRELEMTLNSLGDDAAIYGDSTKITNIALEPSYASARNYVTHYAKRVSENDKDGINTTRQEIKSTDPHNYVNGNQLYKVTENLYPDDNDTGRDRFTNKWKPDNIDSILFKTKKLFKQHKINTLISRFHTDETAPEGLGDVKSKYGLSHGRNLLTKKAEDGQNNYNPNGYDNPYCRVWTHHYQYDSLNKLIRPFALRNQNGETEITSLKDFHIWPNFLLGENGNNGETWGWKDKSNKGWEKSVLGDNGFPKITPVYGGGGKSNIHTKDCMFSIENLAWQGYDPYSFEKALSWEQRGPMGGRIMWFPPYGISFNETTSVRWNSNSFIGRGEDVYTYTNTVRQGTLNFMLVVDHPSIIDYVSWDDKNHSKATDTDLLRFMAGCDGGQTNDFKFVGDNEYIKVNEITKKEIWSDVVDGDKNYETYEQASDSLIDAANPTPLTDEYLQLQASENIKVEENKPAPPIPPEPQIPDTEPRKVEFYVFYPNNYSGYYDKPNSTVEAMAYLLAGVGAQKQADPSNSAHPKDIAISFNELYKMDEYDGAYGYEMKSTSGMSDTSDNENNYIVGTSPNWRFAPNRKEYVDVQSKRWYYRIDGEYEIPSKGEWNINTYDQTLITPTNYRDSNSFNLNSDVERVRTNFSDESENENLYSFAEVAAALAKDEKVMNKIVENGEIDINRERFTKLKELFKEGTITKIISKGFSNSHGNNNDSSVNAARNNNLARQRANSVVEWLRNTCGIQVDDTDIDTTSRPSEKVNVKDEKNVSGESAKIYRSAKVTIEMNVNVTVSLSEAEQISTDEDGNENKDFVRFTGWTYVYTEDGVEYYRNENETASNKKGKLWYYDSKTSEMKLQGLDKDRSNYGSFREQKGVKGIDGTINGDNEFNKVRYDQEYHFFKKLESDAPMVYSSLMEKIKYFDPAFHSMTPEGFNARLTFLNQCTRQGNTVGASDGITAKSANNLAFGRPPYCVLRLGDFYNQMIIIENINISYDPLVWDLNTEGAGVQPLLANVSLSFKFIGGGDMGGAVRRLQNAMSFNYYANASLYDNRADRMEYGFDQKTNGAINHDLSSDSYFHNVTMYKKP